MIRKKKFYQFSSLRIFSVNLTSFEKTFLVGDALANPSVSLVNCKYNLPKLKNMKIDFSFDSTLCASSIKMEPFLRGGDQHILFGTSPVGRTSLVGLYHGKFL